jgi:NTP pyrophosphatase (non-canonical NTP hydrolase)
MKKVEIISPEDIHECAKEKGWWDKDRPVPELLCLMHSELSEALEGYRNHIPEGQPGCFSEELADVIIRIWDVCGAMEIDIVGAVQKKHEFNLTRSYRHGNKRC